MTYTYIEAKSNYHRGSILTFRLVVFVNLSHRSQLTVPDSYLVLVAGFYYAPHRSDELEERDLTGIVTAMSTTCLTFAQSIGLFFSSIFSL
jgi:hypothetical protein